MALPTSTIVMALVTCVPFGLAIRDTVQGNNGARVSAKDREAQAYAEAFEERQRALEEAEASAAKARDAQRAKLAELHGAEPASLGTAFEGLTLGASEPSTGAVMAGLHRYERATRTRIRLEHTRGQLSRVTVEGTSPGRDDEEESVCALLDEQLNVAWGRGEPGAGRTSWIDEAAGVRAILWEDPCRYVVERFVPVIAWIDRTDKTSVIPVWAIGQPAKRLIETLGADAFRDDTQVRWTGPALGSSLGETELFAAVRGGKITGVRATVRTDTEAVQDDLIEHFSAVDAAQQVTESDNTVTYSWRTRPPVSLHVVPIDDLLQLEVTTGTVPKD